MGQARGLGCLVFNCRDLERSKDFYVRVVGFRVVAEDAARKMALLAKGERDQRIALVERATAEPPGAGQPGMIHMAWELGSFEELQAAYRELRAMGMTVEATIEHNVTRSIYFPDPDGNRVELYCDMVEDGFETMRTIGPRVAPLNLEED